MSVNQRLDSARRHQRCGRQQQATRIYEQILREDPTQADALHAIGLRLVESGDLEQAISYLERAVRSSPSAAGIRTNLAMALHRGGYLTEATQCYQRAIQINPNIPDAHNNLGVLQKQQGELEAAVSSLRKALHCRPDYVEARSNLGNALKGLGRHDEAIQCLREAILLSPQYAPAHYNLGCALEAKGELIAAAVAYQEAIRANPDMIDAYNNLGNTLRSLGRAEDAEILYREAVRRAPDHPDAHSNLGALAQDRGDLVAAFPHFQRAAELNPEGFAIHVNIADALNEIGANDEARTHFAHAYRLRPVPRLHLQAALSLPPIYQSLEHLQTSRQRLLNDLDLIEQEGLRLDPETDILPTHFYLAYQGMDDRQVVPRISQLYGPQHDPPVAKRPLGGRKLRIGFVSRFFHDHTIGRLMLGLVERLPRERFEVATITHGKADDAIAKRFQAAAAMIPIPDRLPVARREIAALEFDALFYADVGMDPVTTSLAHSRLAPVQCTTWGHPSTTGSPAIDYFISSEHIETGRGDQHYTERLVRLDQLPTYYYRPHFVGKRLQRADFNLPEKAHLYLCPQSLFKFHPEFDPLLGEILRQDPHGVLVLIAARYPHWNDLLAARLQRSLADVTDRIVVLPRLSSGAFLNLLALGDVMLDPLHFGGGNTSYEALAVGTPVVTLPAPFMRGRVTAGCYQQMGLKELIASSPEEYVRLALQLGQDPALRHQTSERILEAGNRLYEDQRFIEEIGGFLQRVIEAA